MPSEGKPSVLVVNGLTKGRQYTCTLTARSENPAATLLTQRFQDSRPSEPSRAFTPGAADGEALGPPALTGFAKCAACGAS